MKIKCPFCQFWQHYDNGYAVCRNCDSSLHCDNGCSINNIEQLATYYNDNKNEYLCSFCSNTKNKVEWDYID